jgi:phosphatidylglycerol:prolipoprotein diacylglycerol transferase
MNFPDIDPVALSLGPLQIHWYGLMYLFGFVGVWLLGRYRSERYGWTSDEVEDLLFYGAIGVILGGRIGYILFYDLANYIEQPLNIFKVWQGGMSFHGGLIGVILAFWYFAKKTNRSFFAVSDFIAPFVPIGLFCGRIGNFINGELWGNVSDVPWAVVFPTGGPLARHPSQLYEAFLEGIILFIILWFFSQRMRPLGAISGLFLVGYGLFRFLVEFVRVPDEQLGHLAFGWLTMGQILSSPMILLGLYFIWRSYNKYKS